MTGGGAELKGITDYAKQALSLSARIGESTNLGGVDENVSSPSYATATGLMLSDLMDKSSNNQFRGSDNVNEGKSLIRTITSKITEVFSRPRS